MKVEKTKTVLRIYPDGEVIALFPQIASDMMGWNCLSYMYAGQHGGADVGIVVRHTRLATPKEYKILLKELKQRGYKPDIKKRCTRKDYDIRRQRQVSLNK